MGYVIRNAAIIDGRGSPATSGDLVIVNDRVQSVGVVSGTSKHVEIDATGLTIMPGFVDMHSHSDLELIRDPTSAAKVLQGVTLEVLGQDGLGYAPSTGDVHSALSHQLRGWNGGTAGLDWEFGSVGAYLEAFSGRVAVNVAYLAPHGTLRLSAMTDPTAAPTSIEFSRMESLLADALEEGAVGMSAGLMYFPAQATTDGELNALSEVVRDYGGYFAPHHRNYGKRALESYGEMLEIGKASGCAIHLTHANMSFAVNRGRAGELIALIDEFENAGVDVTLDTYPYDAGSTSLHELLPSWLKTGGPSEMLSRLGDRSLRNRLTYDMDVAGSDSFHGIPMDWSTLVIGNVGSSGPQGLAGTTMSDAADAYDLSPVDFAAELLLKAELEVVVVAHIGNEENVREIMQDRRHCVGTDGLLRGDRPHPRGWGTFPRFLGKYVRDLGLMSLERASHKLSYIPCQRLGLTDRGFLAEGSKADLVVLDAALVEDKATFEEPRRSPVGIHYVFVNGEPVVWESLVTGNTPGLFVRRDRATSSINSHPI